MTRPMEQKILSPWFLVKTKKTKSVIKASKESTSQPEGPWFFSCIFHLQIS
ncbi:hypothetical protein KKD84_02220 [Patescibacteria group bacterium]|nr:hypothetical protein [Patescibacteria group bacterium]